MLILTRRVGETFHIGDNISVTVVEVNGNQVRIGIAAPKDVVIMRDDAKKRAPREKSYRPWTMADCELPAFLSIDSAN